MGFGMQDFPDMDPNSEEYKAIKPINEMEAIVDHDAYMVSPDGHKPIETSPTLGDIDPLGAWPFPRGAVFSEKPVEIAASFDVKVTTGETLEQATARIKGNNLDRPSMVAQPPFFKADTGNAELDSKIDYVLVQKQEQQDAEFQADVLAAASTNGDDHVAGVGEKWAFDEKVTSVFDKMLEASIPNYQEMRRLTTNLGRKFIPGADGVIIDIGASRGDALAPFVEKYPDNNYYAVEVSEPMRKVMQTRFLPMTRGRGPNVTICDHDLRYNHSVFGVKSDLILSVLTLMFIPIELRQRLLQSIFDSLKPGGALLLVEKCLGADSYVNDMLVEEYYSMKREHGYTAEQISRKKMALEGVLVPVTVDWNMDMLKRAGFKHIDVYWRSLQFSGFIAVKA